MDYDSRSIGIFFAITVDRKNGSKKNAALTEQSRAEERYLFVFFIVLDIIRLVKN
jgi:hypothetical protein